MSNSEQLSKEIQAKYREIGRFVANFNDVEGRLDEAIGILVNKNDVAIGEIIGAAINSFVVKCNIVWALVHHVGGEQLTKKYKELDQALRNLNKVRVDLVHGEHWLDFNTWQFHMQRSNTTPSGFKTKPLEYTVEQIGSLADRAISLEADLVMFVRRTTSR